MTNQNVADYLLDRLRTWGVQHVFAFPGDGINGILAAWGRADNQPQFIQSRHEEMSAFEAVGYAKFTGRLGVCMATSGPGAIHLLNGLYDAKLDHVPVVAIVGQTSRSAMGGSYQQEVDLLSLFKDVASDYVQMVTVPEQLPNVLDRAIRIAMAERAPTALIIPADVQELPIRRPPMSSRWCRPAWVSTWPTLTPDDEAISSAAELLNAGSKVAMLVGSGARGARAEVVEVADLLGAGRGQGAAGQGRPLRRTAVGHRVDRAAGHPTQLRDDARLRHPPDRRLQLPLHPVHARLRSGPRRADRRRREVDRNALPLRDQHRRPTPARRCGR